jgi:hypothetical protein
MNKPVIDTSNFTGALNLGNHAGTLYKDHAQTGAITLVGSGGSPGGWAFIKITANGDAINVPVAWIKYGGDDISIVAAAVNHVQVFYKDADTIYYTNKVV